jgi:ribosomal protein L7Ae-like RNA K-turn-binding protein
MKTKRVLSILGLCMKAGKLQTGEEQAENLLRTGAAELVIVAGDASGNTRRKFINKCFYYKKPVLIYGNRDELSHSVGKHNRTVYAVTDSAFAKQVSDLIQMEVAECQKSEYMN